jgi:hypothetical protein
LTQAADVAVREVLKIQEGERVLIVTNPCSDVDTISRALYDAVLSSGGVPVLIYQPEKSQLDFCEEAVVRAISSEPDALVSVSANKLGRDERAIKNPYTTPDGKRFDNLFHYLLHGAKRLRSFWSPGVSRDIFEKCVPIDYGRLKEECLQVAGVLTHALSVTIKAPGGTNLTFSVEGRTAFTDDGDFSVPGKGGNLPAGESFISPVVGSAEGTIVFDGSLSVYDGVIFPDTPVTARVADGFVTDISGGGGADKLRDSLEQGALKALQLEEEGKLPRGSGGKYAGNARNIGELGIGLNPSAGIVGNMLVDEKAYNTCHIAIGSNYDDDADALIHLDGLVKNPTITGRMKDGTEVTLLDGGKLVL